MDEIEPVKSEKIDWYNFRQRKFPESLKTNQLVLITRTGGMKAEYAKLIDGEVFLESTGVDGGMLITNQVSCIAKMPIG